MSAMESGKWKWNWSEMRGTRSGAITARKEPKANRRLQPEMALQVMQLSEQL